MFKPLGNDLPYLHYPAIKPRCRYGQARMLISVSTQLQCLYQASDIAHFPRWDAGPSPVTSQHFSQVVITHQSGPG